MTCTKGTSETNLFWPALWNLQVPRKVKMWVIPGVMCSLEGARGLYEECESLHTDILMSPQCPICQQGAETFDICFSIVLERREFRKLLE